ncbi:MAG: TonB-dependent receptor plug domain-containing protein, partial [Robiginitomaculum sp.]|nr:TonB-dependent receptor plug domain-containing protein [Robiginitomaculum sp.]
MIDKKDQLAAFRNAALMGVAAVALMAVPAVAQEQDDDDDEIVVTGSRIERSSNFTGVGPTTVLTKADIDISGKANLGDFLEELPSVTFTADGANANNGSGGLATVNLRGLGASRLLVLFNGRRMNPVGSGTGNLVDLQIFPSSVINGITVLKDGAAAVYGADAMSGVLNFTTPDNFEGVDFVARTGISERGDGAFWNIGMTSGVTSDRGSAMLSLGYREQEGIFQADRPISDCPRLEPAWGGLFGVDVANDQCSGSSFIPAGRIYTSLGSLLVDQPGAGQTPRGFSFFGGDAYNFNPLNYLRTPSTTFNAFAKADYELTETINVELELMYSKRRSDQDLAPVPLGNGAQFTYGLIIPAANPFNQQFWSQIGAPAEDVRYRKRMLDVGARLFSQTSDTVRAVIAFDGIVPGEGNLPILGGAKWDAYYSIDANNGTDENRNLIDMFRVEQALNAEVAPGATAAGNGVVHVGGIFYRCADALARQLGCEPLNMFGNNSITPGAASFIRLNTIDGFSS